MPEGTLDVPLSSRIAEATLVADVFLHLFPVAIHVFPNALQSPFVARREWELDPGQFLVIASSRFSSTLITLDQAANSTSANELSTEDSPTESSFLAAVESCWHLDKRR